MKRDKILSSVDIAQSCVAVVDQGYSKPLNLAQCAEAVTHPTTGLTRLELVEVIAYLSAQVAGYRNAPDREARLSMSQIRSVVEDFYKRTEEPT